LTTVRGSDQAATIIAADTLGAVVEMERGLGVLLGCWSWELTPLSAATDRGPPARLPRPCPRTPRRRLRKARGGRRR
jgi:hypothetical protein